VTDEGKQMSIFVLQVKAAGLPAPIQEHRFAPPRRWRFDYAWPEQMVALEVEGGAFTQGRHTRGAGYVKDMEKYNEAALRGWVVLRVTPKQLSRAVSLIERAFALPPRIRTVEAGEWSARKHDFKKPHLTDKDA
jgi:hypothetical protein